MTAWRWRTSGRRFDYLESAILKRLRDSLTEKMMEYIEDVTGLLMRMYGPDEYAANQVLARYSRIDCLYDTPHVQLSIPPYDVVQDIVEPGIMEEVKHQKEPDPFLKNL